MKNYFQKHVFLFAVLTLYFYFLSPSVAFGAGPSTVNLLSAGNFSLLSKAGITNTGSHSSTITGNIGSSPISAAAVNNIFCSEITGIIYGVDAAYVGSGNQSCFAGNPPLSNKTLVDNAVLDMGIAYNDAAGRPALAPNTNLFAGNLGGQTLAPGLYKWTTDVTIPTNVTLSGSANDIWIFQIAGNLDIASGGSVPAGIKVLLTGGAQPANIFWQVGGGTGATLGTYATFNGNILSATQVILQTGAVLNGKAFAQTLITLDAAKVTGPVVINSPILVPATTTPIVTLPVIEPIVATSTATPINEPVITAPITEPILITGAPTPSTTPPASSSITTIVPGLPNTGIFHQSTTPWLSILGIGFISLVGLVFQSRGKNIKKS